MVVFNVIRVHIASMRNNKSGCGKHSWTSWPRPLLLCPYEVFSKVGDYVPMKFEHHQLYNTTDDAQTSLG